MNIKQLKKATAFAESAIKLDANPNGIAIVTTEGRLFKITGETKYARDKKVRLTCIEYPKSVAVCRYMGLDGVREPAVFMYYWPDGALSIANNPKGEC